MLKGRHTKQFVHIYLEVIVESCSFASQQLCHQAALTTVTAPPQLPLPFPAEASREEKSKQKQIRRWGQDDSVSERIFLRTEWCSTISGKNLRHSYNKAENTHTEWPQWWHGCGWPRRPSTSIKTQQLPASSLTNLLQAEHPGTVAQQLLWLRCAFLLKSHFY